MNIVTEKQCSKCKEVKSVSEFYTDNSRPSGLYPSCKNCHKGYYKSNRSTIIARILSYTDKDKKREYDKKRRLEKKDDIKKEKQLYFQNNKERLLEKFKLYRESNLEKARAYARKWKHEHKEKVNAATNRRRARIKGNGGNITAEEWKSVLNRYGNKCLKCGSTDRIEMDHVVPIALGGINEISNVQPLCRICNARKNNRIEDYR